MKKERMVIFWNQLFIIDKYQLCFVFSSIESVIKIFLSPSTKEKASFSPSCVLTQILATLKVPYFC